MFKRFILSKSRSQLSVKKCLLNGVQYTGKHHDPCVWDLFAAAIHEAKTGEANNWWDWTSMRKALQEKGEL